MVREAPDSNRDRTRAGDGRRDDRSRSLGQPEGHDPTERVRRRHLIWLGVMIFIGFLMPVLLIGFGETRVIFYNIEVQAEKDAPDGFKVVCLYPGVAGLVVVLLAAFSGGIGRSIALSAMGLLFLVLAMVFEDQRGHCVLRFSAETLPSSAALGLVFSVALTGLFVGSRARCFRPNDRKAALLGAAGGILVLLVLVFPLLPPELGSILLLAPLTLPVEGQEVLLRAALVACVAGVMAASILCIVNAKRRPAAQRLARAAFLFLAMGGMAPFVAMIAVMAIAMCGAPSPLAEIAFGGLLMIVKMMLWLIGSLLLIPVGLTDLVVNLSDRRVLGR